METDNFLHPLLPSGGTVRVDVHPLRHLGVRLAGHDPPAESRNGFIPNLSHTSEKADFQSDIVDGWFCLFA